MVTKDLRCSVVAARESSSDSALVEAVELTRVRFAEIYSDCVALGEVSKSEVSEFESLVMECRRSLAESHTKETWRRQAVKRLEFYQQVCEVLLNRGLQEAKALVMKAMTSARGDKTVSGSGLERSAGSSM